MNQKMAFKALLVAVLGMACCPASTSVFKGPQDQVAKITHSKEEFVKDISEKTVALVKKDELGNYMTFCGGVWIRTNLIITAFHCIDENFKGKIEYMTFSSDQPEVAFIKDFDELNDLALLVTKPASTTRKTADISSKVWAGQHISILGHTAGMEWSFIEGVISSIRINQDKSRKIIQVSAPVWFGNSGGGAWDESGKLIGISSSISGKAPNISFFIHYTHVKSLLDRT